MIDNVFPDTSIWIDYFNNQNCIYKEFIIEALLEDKVYSCGIILTEILLGTRTKKEIDLIQEMITGTNIINISSDDYIKAGIFGSSLRRKGISMPFQDLIIASICIRNNLNLVSLDKHFPIIQNYSDLQIYRL